METERAGGSSIFMLFLLRPPTKWRYHDVTMHALFFCQEREFKLYIESVLTCDEKRKEGKGEMDHWPCSDGCYVSRMDGLHYHWS